MYHKKSSKAYLTTYLPAVLFLTVGFLIAYQFVDPAPPKKIVISTGDQSGAYYLFAQRYREKLAENGIELEVRTSAGSIENLELLSDPSSDIDLAFVQGGTGTEVATAAELSAIGSLYFEPLWVFYRAEHTIKRLPDLQGKRVAIGPKGSGTRAVALALMRDNAIGDDAAATQSLGGREAAQALMQGKLDAAFFVASPHSPVIQQLLHADDLHILSFERAEAYTRVHHFLSDVTLPEGVIDFQKNIPPQTAALVAPSASLVIRKEFHAALVSQVLQVVETVHGKGGLFEEPEQFPSPLFLDFPLDPEAKHYYKRGPPFLQRFLPFWIANFIDRMLVMLLPVVALLLPFFKVMPPLFRWRIRKKIYRWYEDLQEIEIPDPDKEPGERLDAILIQLDEIEERIKQIHIPLSYAEELYNLRMHLAMIRDKVARTHRKE